MSNFCTTCGKPLNPQDAFCQNCGARITPSNEAIAKTPDEPQTTVSPTPQEPVPASSDQPQVYVNPNASQPASSTPVQSQAVSGKPVQTAAKKGSVALTIGLVAAAIAVMAAGLFLTRKPAPEPVIHTPIAEPTAPVLPSLPPIQPAETDLPQGTGDFAQYGISCDASLNTEYQYPAIYDDDGTDIPYGELFFTEYEAEPVSSEILAYGTENDMDLSGYEKKTLSSRITFHQSDASDRGVVITRYTTDYYDLNCLSDTGESFEDSYGETYYRYEIEYNDSTEYVYFFIDSQWDDQDSYIEYTETATFLIPAGYDGVIRGYLNPSVEEVTDGEANRDYFLFRLN